MDTHFSRIVGLGLLLPLVGCASMTDWRYEQTQMHRARSAFSQCGCPHQSCYPKDYRNGWLDGFYDVATGNSGCPPTVAPPQYWKPGQILDDCDNRRHEYYSGWQDGAAAASRCPDTHYLKVWESCECPAPRCQTPCVGGGCGISDAFVPMRAPTPAGESLIEVISDEPIGSIHTGKRSARHVPTSPVMIEIRTEPMAAVGPQTGTQTRPRTGPSAADANRVASRRSGTGRGVLAGLEVPGEITTVGFLDGSVNDSLHVDSDAAAAWTPRQP